MSIRALYGARKFIEQNKCSGFLRAGCGLRAGPRVGSIKIAGRGPGREQYLLKLRAAGRAAVTKFRPACNSGMIKVRFTQKSTKSRINDETQQKNTKQKS